MSATIRDRQWNVLLDAIEWDTCIPVLGPNLCVVGKDGSRRNLAIDLSRELAEILLEDKQQKVDDPDNLSLVAQMFQNELSRDELIIEMKAFYEAMPTAPPSEVTLRSSVWHRCPSGCSSRPGMTAR